MRDDERVPGDDEGDVGREEPLFALDEVAVVRGGRRVLDRITLDVSGQGVTVLWGPSGSGKTTLLRLLNRLDVPDAGTVSYRGTPLDDLDPLALRRRVGMVFQTPTPFAGTVRANLAVARPDADDATMTQVLARVSLASELLDRDTGTLSGGEVQRMCLARTLITEPETLLLDEPTSALDEEAKRQFERTAADLAAGGLATVWVSHDRDQLHRIGDHVVRVREGRLTDEPLDDEPLDDEPLDDEARTDEPLDDAAGPREGDRDEEGDR